MKKTTLIFSMVALLFAIQPVFASYSPLTNITFNGSTGLDASANQPALPNIGANFGGSGPYANYVLVRTIGVNANRNYVEVDNTSGVQIVIERDDGTANSGAAPVNGTVFSIGGGAGAGQQGGGWSSQTFRGRLQIFAPTALTGNAYVAAFQD